MQVKRSLFSLFGDRGLVIAGFVALSCVLASAQQFEVASIKPSDPNGRIMWHDMAGQADYTGVTVKMLIQMAYGLRDFQVLGGPAWITSNRYTIAAKAPAASVDFPGDPMTATDRQRETFRDQRRAMVRALLADRFALKVHKETSPLPVYVLTVAKDGPKFGNPGSKAPDPSLRPGMYRFNDGIISANQVGMESLVQSLSLTLDRIILDKTELGGKYDFDLRWTPERNSAPPGDAPPPAAADGPSIFTALREQMGLKLDSAKAPVEVIVIDSVEMPAEN